LIKVLIADNLSQRVIEQLKEIPEFDIDVKPGITPGELQKEISLYEAVILMNDTQLRGEILAFAENLKIIVQGGIGCENIDIDFALSKNIEVRNTPFATSITVAEYTLAQMLGICRFIGPAYRSMKAHRWEKDYFSQGMELYGKTAGIIGFGRIGKEVAKREIALGMNVVFHDINQVETDLEVRRVSLDELLRVSDFISIHIPFNESSRNLISRDEFLKMKKDSVLINVASAGIVDEKALLEALNEDRMKAVALDVYDNEPSGNFELIDNEKVFPAPNLGASTVEGRERAGLDVISILKDFFNV